MLAKFGLVSTEELIWMEGEAGVETSNAISEQDEPSHSLGSAVQTLLPVDATVLVISRGDSRLLCLGQRHSWHFPRDVDGTDARNYPGTDDEAIAHLEPLRSAGAKNLLFPRTAFWSLDHYSHFRDHTT
jgi:hypothetical protein